jgi:hypothetical protein
MVTLVVLVVVVRAIKVKSVVQGPLIKVSLEVLQLLVEVVTFLVVAVVVLEQ